MDGKKKLVRSYRQTLTGSAAEIFPLLCPVREKDWLPGWDYQLIYSESGYAEKGCVFETGNVYGSYRWIVTNYDSDIYTIQFVKINEDVSVIIDIALEEERRDLCHCQIEYAFIPHNEETAEQVYRENSAENFRSHMQIWETALNYYLQRHEMLPSE